MTDRDDDDRTYMVIVNDEEQHCLWPETVAVPAGWRFAGCRGSKADCVAHVEAMWTDIRPLSIRRQTVPGAAPGGLASDLQRTVSRLWEEVLQLGGVAPDDDFLELGGQSLQAVLLLGRVKETFGIDVPLKDFFMDPTVRGLSRRIADMTAPAESHLAPVDGTV